MAQPLLSICIPTYNRAHYLKECLESIVSQFTDEEIKNQVEIVISDNASPDNTEALVESFRKRYDNIFYYRNCENIEFDKNVINAVKTAQGKYGWYLGDDDIICRGGLRFVCNYLARHEVSVLTVDSSAYTGSDCSLQPAAPKISEFESYDDFFFGGHCLGILSVLVFNRSEWLKNDLNRFTWGWSYYEFILRLMPKAAIKKYAHIHASVISARQDSSWNKGGVELLVFLTWKDLYSRLSDFGFNQVWTGRELRKFPRQLPLILLRAKGHDLAVNGKNYKLIFQAFKNRPLYLILATIIFIIPNRIIKTVRDARKRLKLMQTKNNFEPYG